MDNSKLKQAFSSALSSVSISTLGVSISLADLGKTQTVDERIARLGKIKEDLEAAIGAVEELQCDADTSKVQVDTLRKDIADLQQDRATAQHLLNVPEESFARVLARSTRKGEIRGAIIGVLIGLVTGCVSSYIVWTLTKDETAKPPESEISAIPTVDKIP